MPTFRLGATVLDAIGSTPLIEVDGIWVKLEYLNPSGSINARMARYIIERAESEGLLHPGDTIANGFVPDIYRRYSSLVDRVIAVHGDEAITEMRQLAREHGLMVGPSSGANLVAARRLLDEVPRGVDGRHDLLRRGGEVPDRVLHTHPALRGSQITPEETASADVSDQAAVLFRGGRCRRTAPACARVR